MMTDKDRIRLAHAINDSPLEGGRDRVNQVTFDPEHDANDCDALIRHLNSIGWTVTIQFHVQFGFWVELANWHDADKKYLRNVTDWKQGVFELALKVIRQQRMDELGITEQDIAETMPPEPGR